MRRWGVLVGLWLVSGALAQEVRLQEDARLQETLAIQEPFAPLRQVLRAVQDATGVPLHADRAVAEDKVCVLTRERPAHEILTRLAETLRYSWQPSTDGNGYRLTQPASERAREQSLLRAYEQWRIDAVQKPLRETVQLLRRHNRQQLEKLAADPQSRLSPEAKGLLKEMLTDPKVDLAMQTLAALPDSVVSRIAQGETVSFSSHPAPGEFPLPDALKQQVLEYERAVTNDVYPKDSRSAWRSTPERLSCNISSTRNTAAENGATSWEIMRPRSVAEDALAQHPQSAVWREWHSDAAAFRALTPTKARAPTLTIPEPIRRSPLVALIRYAREHGLDLYADAYRLRLFLGDERERTPQVDFERARNQFFWVRLEGETLMARYRAYPLLRPSEIPEPLLEPLERKLRAKQEITLDEWATFATQLTPMQIARASGWVNLAGQPVFHETLVPMENLVVVLPALRFWASLSPQQRRAALEGERLLPERMTPKQRELFVQAATYAPEDPEGFTPGGKGSFFVTWEAATGDRQPYFRVSRLSSAVQPQTLILSDAEGVEPSIAPPAASDRSDAPRTIGELSGWLLCFVSVGRERAYKVIGGRKG
jgi:hypothetical protein